MSIENGIPEDLAAAFREQGPRRHLIVRAGRLDRNLVQGHTKPGVPFMADAEEPALFTLSAHDAASRIAQMFSGAAARSMFGVPVGAALMLAEAATQKLSLDALRTRESGSLPPTDTIEIVEQLVAMYFEGKPATIDSVLWDQEGYIHGWPLDQDGRAHASRGSFPETVRALAQALRALSSCLPDWRDLLENHAKTLETILHNSRKHAELVAQQRVASQSWLARLRKPRSVAAELVSLGFTDSA